MCVWDCSCLNYVICKLCVWECSRLTYVICKLCVCGIARVLLTLLLFDGVLWCSTHIVLCVFLCVSPSCVPCAVNISGLSILLLQLRRSLTITCNTTGWHGFWPFSLLFIDIRTSLFGHDENDKTMMIWVINPNKYIPGSQY